MDVADAVLKYRDTYICGMRHNKDGFFLCSVYLIKRYEVGPVTM